MSIAIDRDVTQHSSFPSRIKPLIKQYIKVTHIQITSLFY